MVQTGSLNHFLVRIFSLMTKCLVVKRTLFGLPFSNFYLIFSHLYKFFVCVYFSDELMGTMFMQVPQRSE